MKALVVGTGFGCRIHVPALRAAGLEVVGLVGTNPGKLAKRAKAAGVPDTFTDLDEAITRTGAQIVTVATPPDSHAKLALTAIAHGCHVLCEKPMAMDTAEAQAMFDAAEKAGVTHLMGNEFRWQPDRAMLGRAIADGAIGKPRLLTLTQYLDFAADPEARLPKWWFVSEAGGGWLGASGSHIVDQIIAWLGPIESLSASLPVVSDRPEGVAEDTYIMRFRSESGVEGVLQHTAGAWGPMASTWRLAGTNGTIWLDDTGRVHVADRAGQRTLDMPADLQLPEPPPVEGADSAARFSHLELGPYTRLCEALRAGVEGKPYESAVPVPTFADGLATMKVIDAIRKSAATGGELVRIAA
jgi:predicted dehydrogenase